MAICKNCGVELEEDMQYCPLCGQTVNGDDKSREMLFHSRHPASFSNQNPAHRDKFTWEIVSLILLSAIVATVLIDFIINKKITWAEYPAAISLVIFCYTSVFAFWKRRTIVQLLAGFVLSATCFIVLDALTAQNAWAIELGIPILLAVNFIVAGMLTVIRLSKEKGINLLAWAFLGAGLLCICLEGIVSYYHSKKLVFNWSVIAGASIVPMILVLFFVHFRLKKGRSLKKTFHI